MTYCSFVHIFKYYIDSPRQSLYLSLRASLTVSLESLLTYLVSFAPVSVPPRISPCFHNLPPRLFYRFTCLSSYLSMSS